MNEQEVKAKIRAASIVASALSKALLQLERASPAARQPLIDECLALAGDAKNQLNAVDRGTCVHGLDVSMVCGDCLNEAQR